MVPSSGPSTNKGEERAIMEGRIEGVKACAPERNAIASANREATMVELDVRGEGRKKVLNA